MRASAGGPPRYRRPTPPENHAPAKTPRPAASAPSSRPHSSIRTTPQTAANPPASPDRHSPRYARDGTTPRFPAPRRKHMPRPCQIIRRCAIGDRGTDSREPVGGGNPRRHPARHLDRHRKRRTASASIHKQTIPLHKRIISASCPTVISDAADTGSLSFPRSASSTSDTPPPAASAETAAGIRRAETSPHIPSSSIEYARQTQGATVRKTSRKNDCRFAGNSTEFARSAKRQANIKPEKTTRRQIVRNCNKPFSGTGKPLS